MSNLKKLIQEREFLDAMNELSMVYEEISIARIQKIRAHVLHTRIFLNKLMEVYYIVQNSRDDSDELPKSMLTELKKINTVFSQNKKTVKVLLTANTKLYGDLIKQTTLKFINDIKPDDNLIIVGEIGKEIFEEKQIKHEYTYFEVPDFNFSYLDLKNIINKITQYENVIVYYGNFINMAEQEAVAKKITGQDQIRDIKNETNEKVGYIFEPSRTDILNFFQSQVAIMAFKQSMHENELARLASRVGAMERAIDNIKKEKTLNTNKILQSRRKIKDWKQAEKLYTIIASQC